MSIEQLRFSRPTIVEAIEILSEILTHAQFSWFLLRCGPDLGRLAGDEVTPIPKRRVKLLQWYDAHPGHICDDRSPLGVKLVQEAVIELGRRRMPYLTGADDPDEPKREALGRALARDGYSIEGDELRAMLPVDLGLPSARDELMSSLDKHGFTDAVGHLKQALDAHTGAQWASANAQMRSFVDSLFDTIAERLDPSASTLPSGQQRRSKLAALNFFDRDLNEWSDNGGGYINGLTKRLHPQGAHPGLSDADDSTFRLHTVLLVALFFMRRFDRFGSAARP